MTDRRLPSERFYLARLDTSGVGRARGRRRAERLGCLFEEVLPVPIEEVHAVYLDAGPGAVLACGMERGELTEAAGDVRTMGPADLPGYLGGDHLDPTSINLLIGEFEPAALRRSRRRVAVEVAAVLALCTLALTGGTERRIGALRDHAREATLATAEVYREVLPPTTGPVPDSVRLTTELRRLRATRSDPATTAAIPDAGLRLASLLERWPPEARTRTELVAVGAGATRITAGVPDAESGQRLVSAFDGPGPWSVSRHQVAQSRTGVQVQLTLAPAGAAP